MDMNLGSISIRVVSGELVIVHHFDPTAVRVVSREKLFEATCAAKRFSDQFEEVHGVVRQKPPVPGTLAKIAFDPTEAMDQIVRASDGSHDVLITKEAIELLKKVNQVGCKAPIDYFEAQRRVDAQKKIVTPWYKKFWRKFSKA